MREEELILLRLFGGGYGSGTDAMVVVAFLVFGIVAFLAPVLGLAYLSCAYNDRGCALARSGDYSRAELDFLESVRIDPESEGGHANLAKCYCDMGRSAEAIKSLESTERYRKDLDQEELRELRDRIEGRFRVAGASQPTSPAGDTGGKPGSREEFLDPRLPQPSQNGNNGSRANKVLESLAWSSPRKMDTELRVFLVVRPFKDLRR